MAALTKDHSLDRGFITHALSYVGVAANAAEIYKGAYLQQSSAGYAVMLGDPLGSGHVIGVAEKNVPDQTGAANGDATVRAIVGAFERPIDNTTPVTDADMFKPVYAANNFDVTSDPTKPRLGTLVGINNDANTCTVLIEAGAGAVAASGLTLLATKTFTSADLTTAGVGPQHINVGSPIPDTYVVAFVRSKLDDAFDNGSGVSLTMTLGHDGDRDAYEEGFDAFTGAALESAGWARVTAGVGVLASTVDGTSTGQLSASFTAGADQLANFTDGSITVEFWGYKL